jgi:hypothetical protein
MTDFEILKKAVRILLDERLVCGHCNDACYDDGTCYESFGIDDDNGNYIQFKKSTKLDEQLMQELKRIVADI